jgi:hypothetical protein
MTPHTHFENTYQFNTVCSYHVIMGLIMTILFYKYVLCK